MFGGGERRGSETRREGFQRGFGTWDIIGCRWNCDWYRGVIFSILSLRQKGRRDPKEANEQTNKESSCSTFCSSRAEATPCWSLWVSCESPDELRVVLSPAPTPTSHLPMEISPGFCERLLVSTRPPIDLCWCSSQRSAEAETEGLKPKRLKPEGLKPEGMKPEGLKQRGWNRGAATSSTTSSSSFSLLLLFYFIFFFFYYFFNFFVSSSSSRSSRSTRKGVLTVLVKTQITNNKCENSHDMLQPLILVL